MPFALGLVRKLAAGGREIYAADDHMLPPGNHSKYLAGHFVYPSPRSDTAGFLAELERIVQEHEIDLIVPAFEEVFYISTQIERLRQFTAVFASPFRMLARLHDKGAFERLVTRLGLPIPETVLVTSDDELREATARLDPVFRSRRVLARRGVLSDEHRPAGRCAGDRPGPSVASGTVAGAGVPRR
jgi:predicted ATP-grasp superfamily ATP-dependent carboligase